MNGDVSKMPSGAVYTTTSSSDTNISMAPTTDYATVNGVSEGAEGLGAVQPLAPLDNVTTVYPLPQLKQMLSQQLEYYFSRLEITLYVSFPVVLQCILFIAGRIWLMIRICCRKWTMINMYLYGRWRTSIR